MNRKIFLLLMLALPLTGWADDADAYSKALKKFRETPAIAAMMAESYGYALFPTVGKGGFGIGAAFGNGRVYVGGKHVGDTSLGQISIGFQIGGTAFSEIVLFKNKDAFDEFSAGSFAFGAEASVVAINAGAQAMATTTGSSSSASDAAPGGAAQGNWKGGMATFVYAKGGLMYEASISGQRFEYSAIQ